MASQNLRTSGSKKVLPENRKKKTNPQKRSSGKSNAKRKRCKRRKKKFYMYRKRAVLIILAIVLLAALVMGLRSCMGCADSTDKAEKKEDISQNVIDYKPVVEQYAQQYGIEEYVDLLLAIMQVESRGEGNDVMQSSESMGLPVNSLMPEASIQQGCYVFSQLLDYGEQLGCDLNSMIQAYNFGITYLDYVAENGKVHTFDLAQSFSKEMSGGEKVDYVNALSVERNGGWRYNYGNMFYVELVRQYYPE